MYCNRYDSAARFQNSLCSRHALKNISFARHRYELRSRCDQNTKLLLININQPLMFYCYTPVMKNQSPVFQDQQTIKQREREIQLEHIRALKNLNEELKILFSQSTTK